MIRTASRLLADEIYLGSSYDKAFGHSALSLRDEQGQLLTDHIIGLETALETAVNSR